MERIKKALWVIFLLSLVAIVWYGVPYIWDVFKTQAAVQMIATEKENLHQVLKESYVEFEANKAPKAWENVSSNGSMISAVSGGTYANAVCTKKIPLKGEGVVYGYLPTGHIVYVDGKWYMPIQAKRYINKTDAIDHINSCIPELEKAMRKEKDSERNNSKSWE